MEFDEIKKLLEKYNFRGFTVHREEYSLLYTFLNVSYFAVEIKVNVIKLDPQNIKSPKLVSCVYVDNAKFESIEELLVALKNINNLHKTILYERKTNYSSNER